MARYSYVNTQGLSGDRHFSVKNFAVHLKNFAVHAEAGQTTSVDFTQHSPVAGRGMSGNKVHEAQFELLFAQYEPELRRFLERYLPDKTDIEDCAQEAFLHVWKQESRGALRENPKNYLFMTARNVVRDLWRRNRARHRQHHVELTVDVDAVRNIQNEKSLAEREAVRLIETHLKHLKEPTRAVFLLFHVEQMTCEAIAAHLNMSQRTVEREMARALDFYRSKFGTLMQDILE